MQLVEDYGDRFNLINITTALHRLGACGLHPGGNEAKRLLKDSRFLQLERLAGEGPGAIGKAGCRGSGPDSPATCRIAVLLATHTTVVLVRFGLTTPQRPIPNDLHSVEAHVTSFDSRGAVNSLWALAKLGYHPMTDALAAWDDESGRDVPLGGAFPEDEGGRLVGVLCSHIEEILADLVQQEVANTLWALGTLGGCWVGIRG